MKILPDDSEIVIQLDRKRASWKGKQTQTPPEDYLDILAQVQTKVLSMYSLLRREIKAWEIEFVSKNGREPWNDDWNADTKNKYKRYHLAKQMLNHWQITVHT